MTSNNDEEGDKGTESGTWQGKGGEEGRKERRGKKGRVVVEEGKRRKDRRSRRMIGKRERNGEVAGGRGRKEKKKEGAATSIPRSCACFARSKRSNELHTLTGSRLVLVCEGPVPLPHAASIL